MRLIDADALKERADEVTFMGFQAVERKKRFMDLVSAMVESSPTIDAVPVVRCKDCKHMERIIQGFYCKVWGGFNGCGGDGFCSYGGRKDGAE